MLLVDAHLDLAWGARNVGRDVLTSSATKRAKEAAAGPHGTAMVGYDELVRAQAAVVFATLYAEPARNRMSAGAVYDNVDQAHVIALDQIAYYSLLFTLEPRIRLISSRHDLDEHLSTWANDKNQVGFVLLMEGADSIRTPSEVAFWFERGLRIVGPAWHGTQYSGGTGDPGPLTSAGRLLLDSMARVGMILDISHMADESLAEALERFTGPIIASHSNCRALAPGDRQLSDPSIRRLGEKDAVIGVALSDRQLRGKDQSGNFITERSTLDTVVDHIDHMCQVIGDAEHVGLGTDLDGGFGLERTPVGLSNYGDLQMLADVLSRRGYAANNIEGIFGKNFLRLLRQGLP